MTSQSVGRRVEQSLAGVVFRPAWVFFAAITVLFLAGVSMPVEYQWIPLIASVVLLGLPHGAVDHLALPRVYGDSLTGRWIVVVVGLYAVVGGAYLLLWFVAPAIAFLIFILITWAHWGQGEIYPLLALASVDHLPGPVSRAATAAVRGALPMLVPFVAFPDQYQLVAETLVGLYSTAGAEALDAVFTLTARLVVGTVVGALIVLTLAVGGVRARQTDAVNGWLLDVGETVLLVAFFASVPPILAIGLYFCFWHALRHIARLVAVDSGARGAIEDNNQWAAVRRFIRDATPLTIASVMLLVGLYFITPDPPETIPEFVGLYLVLIAVLTLPHVVVVSWMDYRQQIFATIYE